MTASQVSDPATARAAARVGQVLRQKWRLDRLLGVGGMASVYAATHRNSMRGAVKMLHLELCTHADLYQRFLREGYVANQVGHPGAVRVLDDDVAEDGSVFLVMELLEGESLAARREKLPGGVLPVAEVLSLADALLDVLAAAHEKGIVHRDIKPDNLFLTAAGELKILDFGIARMRDAQASGQITQGGAMGTPFFMPPEQALGRWAEVDGRSDLWAVGATMFKLLAGRPVHQGETVQEVMLAAMTKLAPPLATVAPHVPPQVCSIVDAALAFEKKRRWPDARAMQRAVREAMGAPPATVSMPAPASVPAVTGPGPSGSYPSGAPLGGSLDAPSGVAGAPGGTTESPLSRDRTQPHAGRSGSGGGRSTLVLAGVAAAVTVALGVWLVVPGLRGSPAPQDTAVIGPSASGATSAAGAAPSGAALSAGAPASSSVAAASASGAETAPVSASASASASAPPGVGAPARPGAPLVSPPPRSSAPPPKIAPSAGPRKGFDGRF